MQIFRIRIILKRRRWKLCQDCSFDMFQLHTSFIRMERSSLVLHSKATTRSNTQWLPRNTPEEEHSDWENGWPDPWLLCRRVSSYKLWPLVLSPPRSARHKPQVSCWWTIVSSSPLQDNSISGNLHMYSELYSMVFYNADCHLNAM